MTYCNLTLKSFDDPEAHDGIEAKGAPESQEVEASDNDAAELPPTETGDATPAIVVDTEVVTDGPIHRSKIETEAVDQDVATDSADTVMGDTTEVGAGGATVDAGTVRPDVSVVRLIERASHSAGRLVNLLAKHFPAFRDEGRFEGRKVRFLKRAQIFVADLWAAFNKVGLGEFLDIGHVTMFAGECTIRPAGEEHRVCLLGGQTAFPLAWSSHMHRR